MVSVFLLWAAVLGGASAQYFSGEGHPLGQDEGPYHREFAPQGFQFSSFRGPVSGVIKEIQVPYVHPPPSPHQPHTYRTSNNHPQTSFDYVAKPDYAFTFGVRDPESGNAQARQESRDGDSVRGEYSVMEPDGTLRTVTYTADPVKGFQAKVKYGPSGLPPPPPPTPSPTPGHTGVRQEPRPRPVPQHRFRPNKPPAYKSYDEYDEN